VKWRWIGVAFRIAFYETLVPDHSEYASRDVDRIPSYEIDRASVGSRDIAVLRL
jgi:hypothetical protein